MIDDELMKQVVRSKRPVERLFDAAQCLRGVRDFAARQGGGEAVQALDKLITEAERLAKKRAD